MADDGGALVGAWKLVSCFMEDLETGERKLPWGEHPNGRLVMTPGGRWIVIQTAEDRKAPQNDQERAAAFRSLLAYSGTYRTEANRIIIKVDIAWDESWVGTAQVRSYVIKGERLHIEAAPQPYANFGGRVMRGMLIWTRDEI
jgi:hypothetical protein